MRGHVLVVQHQRDVAVHFARLAVQCCEVLNHVLLRQSKNSRIGLGVASSDIFAYVLQMKQRRARNDVLNRVRHLDRRDCARARVNKFQQSHEGLMINVVAHHGRDAIVPTACKRVFGYLGEEGVCVNSVDHVIVAVRCQQRQFFEHRGRE